jgi:hypothetical protein
MQARIKFWLSASYTLFRHYGNTYNNFTYNEFSNNCGSYKT